MSERRGGSDWGGSDPLFDSADNRPPDDPPKVIFHNPFPGQQIPEEYRRVFGSPPPPNSKKPVPPPPLPPNSYHKKPKYWQLRHTSNTNKQTVIQSIDNQKILTAFQAPPKYPIV
jgi:hypothetical protein